MTEIPAGEALNAAASPRFGLRRIAVGLPIVLAALLGMALFLPWNSYHNHSDGAPDGASLGTSNALEAHLPADVELIIAAILLVVVALVARGHRHLWLIPALCLPITFVCLLANPGLWPERIIADDYHGIRISVGPTALATALMAAVTFAVLVLAVLGLVLVVRARDAAPGMVRDEAARARRRKVCPHCAEVIRAEASICRYCQREQTLA